jgi:hypothetical protein
MFWAKRRFRHADYVPHFERLEKLLMANPAQYAQFIMVSTKVNAAEGEFYVGVPNKAFLAAFDGFAPVADDELPKVIDTLHIADATKDPFKSRFVFRHNL